MAYAKSFIQTEVEHPEKVTAYEMWCSLWHNRGRGEMFIGAPTLEELEARWEQITHSDLDKRQAQHIHITAVGKSEK